MKLVSLIKEYLEKRKYIIVHEYENVYGWKNRFGESINETTQVMYYLFENAYGNRKIKTIVSGYRKNHKSTNPKEDEIYRKTFYPWLHGRDNASIQSYNQAKQGNVMTTLKRTPK